MCPAFPNVFQRAHEIVHQGPLMKLINLRRGPGPMIINIFTASMKSVYRTWKTTRDCQRKDENDRASFTVRRFSRVGTPLRFLLCRLNSVLYGVDVPFWDHNRSLFEWRLIRCRRCIKGRQRERPESKATKVDLNVSNSMEFMKQHLNIWHSESSGLIGSGL